MSHRSLMVGLVLGVGLTITLGFNACGKVGGGFIPGSDPVDKAGGAGMSSGGTTTDNPKPTLEVRFKNYEPQVGGPPVLCVGSTRLFPAGSIPEGGAVAQPQDAEPSDSSSSGVTIRSTSTSTSSSTSSITLTRDGMSETTYTSTQTTYTNHEVRVNPSGADVGAMEASLGSYDRVIITLSAECVSGLSVQAQNPNGSHSTAEPVQLQFLGHFDLNSSHQILELNVAPFVEALSQVRSSGEIKPTLESIVGGF